MRALFAALPLLLLLCVPGFAQVSASVGELQDVSGYRSLAGVGASYRGGSRVPMFGSLASRARAHMGATARDLGLPGRAWCADFMNKITGGGTGSRLARSYASYGRPAAYGCVDCIVVLTRGRRGNAGHVGVVTGYDARGNLIIVSGNHNRRVGEGVYSKRRVIALRSV